VVYPNQGREISVLKFRACRYLFPLVVGAFAAVIISTTFAGRASAAPAIRLKGNGLDIFKFHGRVKLDPPTLGGPVDPLVDGFGVGIVNEFGVIYEASLGAGDLEPRGNLRYRFKDRRAQRGEGTRAGLFQVITRFREYADGWYYTVHIRAFADLSSATEPWMTVFFSEVDGTATLTAQWIPKWYGWRLPLGRF
jgi:hypothetical protein